VRQEVSFDSLSYRDFDMNQGAKIRAMQMYSDCFYNSESGQKTKTWMGQNLVLGALYNLKLYLLRVFFLMFSISLSSQNVKFTAYVDVEEILTGNYFQITFKLSNAKGSEFTPPSFVDFSVLAGPNRSSQMSIINGRTTQALSYSYTLMPDKPGTFTIAGATIKVGSKTMKSNDVKVKVLKAVTKRNNIPGFLPDEEVIIDLELSDSIAYVGQQVTLKYVIYTSLDIRSYNIINESDYSGFYVENLQNYKEQALRVVIDNKQYVKQTLKAIALFPQQTGLAKIESSLVNLGIAIKSERLSFFFSTSMRSKKIRTPSKLIQILSAPPGAPESFSGAIGQFDMTCDIDKKIISLDGAITITMKIEGDGDARFVGPPKQKLEDFEVYEPNLLKEVNRIEDGRIKFSKTYEYLMVPKTDGTLSIIPEFSYYNIDSSVYITKYGPHYRVKVVGKQQNQSISTENMNGRIAPIYTKTVFRASSYKPLFSIGHIVFLSACGLAFLILAVLKWRDIQKSRINPVVLKNKWAKKIAKAKLKQSKTHLDKNEIVEFYSSLRESLFSYLSDKFNLPLAQISKNSLSQLFNKNQLSRKNCDFFFRYD